MRYNIYENGGAVEGLVTLSGMTITGYITLRGDPFERMEAVSKQYVDFLASVARSNHIVSGTFNQLRLPAFTGGQVTSVAGNNVLTIIPTGVAPNTYTKITVGVNGLVTSGSNLTPADIPNLGWLKIVTGKPTTLAGYGISDGVTKVGGTVIGVLTANSHPVDTKDVATKQYTDSKVLNNKTYAVGDLITGGYDTPPTGFLRCNGGEVSKTTYAALYSLIGDTYSPPAEEGGEGLGLYAYGKPWSMQYRINQSQTSILTGYQTATAFPVNISVSNSVVTKNRVYVFPGFINGNLTTNYYTAPINPDGTLGTWTIAGQTPTTVLDSACLIVKNRLYLIGGWANLSSIVSNRLLTATINPDGTIGAWVLSTLPVSIGGTEAFYVHGKIFVFPGWENGGLTNTVLIGELSEDGTTVAWTTTVSPGFTNATETCFTIDNNMYSIINSVVDNPSFFIWERYLFEDGSYSSLIPKTSYPGHSYGPPVVTENAIYLFNYIDPNTSSYTGAKITLSNGTFGELTKFTGISTYRKNFTTFVTGGKVYVVGGEEVVSGSVTYRNHVASFNFSGGLNDYTLYYDETIASGSGTIDPDKFRLPDYTSTTDPVGKVFVKF